MDDDQKNSMPDDFILLPEYPDKKSFMNQMSKQRQRNELTLAKSHVHGYYNTYYSDVKPSKTSNTICDHEKALKITSGGELVFEVGDEVLMHTNRRCARDLWITMTAIFQPNLLPFIETRKFINIKKDFTDSPGGRYRSDGQFSGEEFREDYLEPLFENTDVNEIEIDFDGGFGYASCWLDEVFGGLVKKYGYHNVKNKLILISNDEPGLIEDIKKYMENNIPYLND